MSPLSVFLLVLSRLCTVVYFVKHYVQLRGTGDNALSVNRPKKLNMLIIIKSARQIWFTYEVEASGCQALG